MATESRAGPLGLIEEDRFAGYRKAEEVVYLRYGSRFRVLPP